MPNLLIAAIQSDSVSGAYLTPGAFAVIRRGTLSGDTQISSNQFNIATPNNAAPDGVYRILVALDTAGAANQAYSVWMMNQQAANTVNAEAKILAFRGLSAAWVDTGSVSVGTTRTVIGTVTTGFASGDEIRPLHATFRRMDEGMRGDGPERAHCRRWLGIPGWRTATAPAFGL